MASGFNNIEGANSSEFRRAGRPGVHSSGAYLVGARPFLIKQSLDGDSVYKVEFPFITRAITVINQDAESDDVEIAFANDANAWDHHSITLANNRDSITMNVRTSAVYLRTTGDPGDAVSIEIFAEMTDIDAAASGDWSNSQNRKGVDTDLDGSTEIIKQ